VKIESLGIDGAWIIKSKLNLDLRGSFHEWFNYDEFKRYIEIPFEPRQANISKSVNGVIRGIHYSLSKAGQSKLVTCVGGRINDVIVDIRQGSPTYGEWVSIEISAFDGQSILIPRDLGHGFSALEDETCVSYLQSSTYSPGEEFGVNPLDDSLKIDWRVRSEIIKISDKDSLAPTLLQQYKSNLLPRYLPERGNI